MNTSIYSSAQVPRELYIERDADFQIRQVINEMARPGYVLVARQMGKTNLLLHTKELLQNERNIYVYIDFSTMSHYSEQECLNTLIDTAIEVNYAIFSEAESQILEIRNKPFYNACRMYNRELRILLKYVDKIVFILDEIDALVRTEYSDRVFSLIRGHYFADTNFPELKKATYILSGVIEPKDIIKDPNVSPFNIGEKIYLSDFTREEFSRLCNNSQFLRDSDEIIIDRLYYWTKGQPRMSWDLCAEAERIKVRSAEQVDLLVRDMYLTTFDRAPVDSIRDKVCAEPELQDALIQLSINKVESLSDAVKSKLYLSGIIEYNQTLPEFKNPILAKSLSYDWLMFIHKDLNYLTSADKSIHLERNYTKAISHLAKYLESNPTDIDDIDRAHYLMSEAYYRTYMSESSLKYLEYFNKRGKESKYHLKSILLKGHTLSSEGKFQEAESCYRELMEKTDKVSNSSLYFKAVIGLVAVLLSYDNNERTDDAEKILNNELATATESLLKNNNLSTVFYYLANVELRRGNKEKCVKYIDSALPASQPVERPHLLYVKFQNLDKPSRDDTAEELYRSLSEIKTRPEPEDFDNVLGFNLLYASQILASLMLEYPQYDITAYLRFFLYESKENAVIYIYELLNKFEDGLTEDFQKQISRLSHTEGWNFDFSQRCYIAILQLMHNSDPRDSEELMASLNLEESSYPSELVNLFAKLTFYYIKNKDNRSARGVVDVYKSVNKRIKEIRQKDSLLMDYYECYIMYSENDLQNFPHTAAVLLENVKTIRHAYDQSHDDNLRLSDVDTIISNLTKWMRVTNDTYRQLGPWTNPAMIPRNTKVRVKYVSDGRETIDKYKHVEHDIRIGLCSIIEIL